MCRLTGKKLGWSLSVKILIIRHASSTLCLFPLQDTMARRPADPEEELRWMSQEVRGYVEAVLNSLAANVPKVSLFS